MAAATVLRTTFVPVDLGARLRKGTDHEEVLEAFASHGWEKVDRSDELQIAGPGSSVHRHREGPHFYTLPSGFGVLRLDRTTAAFASPEEFCAVEHLLGRREHHHAVLSLKDDLLPANMPVLIDRLRKQARAAAPSHGGRPLDLEPFQYCMSIYFLKGFPADLGECSEELRQNLAAALEPSLLRLDDTPFAELPERRLEEARELVREIEVDASHFRDSDLSSDVGAYMSWPTVLITGEIDDETIRHYAALEVKVQASWLAAFSLAKTAGELIQKLDRDKMSLRKVESIGWELTGLESDVGASIDASVSSRYRQALDTMIETSGLRREWGRARQRLAEVRAYASFRTSDRNYRFQQAIELLLLIAAVATVTPVFVSIPLQSVDDVTSQLAPLASIATVLLVGTLFVLLRRR